MPRFFAPNAPRAARQDAAIAATVIVTVSFSSR